jgi:hypothetical protein
MYGTCLKCGYYCWLDEKWLLCYNCANPQIYTIPQQFNYECPDCHGKFNYAVIPVITSSLYYKCPFCGRTMEGLK